MTALLKIENLAIQTGGKPLVADVSLSIDGGERVGFIGESGSGKSLTALAAIGLLPDTLKASGSVLLGGREVIGARDRDLVPLRGTAAAVVFQEPLTALDPLVKIGRQVGEAVKRRAKRDGATTDKASITKEVVALLDQVALPEPNRIVDAWPHEISGGQRQRAAIAMALACKPKLLIADEPTTALDVTTQAEILALMARLVKERDMALLFISHDLPVVAGAVDRVVVMQHGRIVETGAVSDVFGRPGHPYTQSLVAAARAFDNALEIAR
ncbi:ATP-binding cassette domain-containing protein [Aliirhizobium cellulosilyticum]|uniref:Peptide/nickel transport system ATP-binding protein n=1 Tax=Aliirhizobium cellulosilyticum TaxID=393664 RepID=A0A7W6THZ3_9HYPH|nr:ABC transporter ATP-binding protein [Rhizobium cellulosilyticum]MBB4350596.1 peptide/nickel transport system ATP-binding protein [Rhizobium cellulosilyticum]MBB4413791.1 peptide/nickel transport system ATP-binding protein [Rhizobium cellulosilyticum]MBB4448406.1 peptide/nickel transport system ATP-binding protein [Rhizobium cellulosilyticum]